MKYVLLCGDGFLFHFRLVFSSTKNTTKNPERARERKSEKKRRETFIVYEQIRSILFGRLHRCRWYGFVFSLHHRSSIHFQQYCTLQYSLRSWIWTQIVFQFISMFRSFHRSYCTILCTIFYCSFLLLLLLDIAHTTNN